ncbi:putative DNA helicase IV [Vibrio nigripulchritudo SOn1]|uniref:DNA 3'-5' helicase n=1 Tax=Vibrio nigripulchritudo SOn1 TaxID=1238450 RepID=A0AAV2VU40_9VIBR|nr:DNA helicase IV [Vibrio nigripulchritudo]CCO47934.1 putative DNA helicase IV [Vibrio nigripulchritudo SOn1]
MQVTASRSAKFLIQSEYNEVCIEGDKLILNSAQSEEHIPFSVWNGSITLKRGLMWGSLVFHAHAKNNKQQAWLVQGLPWGECNRFVKQAQHEYSSWHYNQCKSLNEKLPSWQETLDLMRSQPAYLPTSQLNNWKNAVSEDFALLNMSLEEAQQRMPDAMTSVSDWLINGESNQKTRNLEWLEKEREYWQVLFAQVESSPLNLSQQQAVLMNNDHNLVLAGAGTGKTSVLTARVSYLLQSHQAKPEDMLMVAFGRDAASEMRQRLETKLGSDGQAISVKTFHQLGLDIIRHVENESVEITPLATNDNMKQAWCVQWLKQHWATQNQFKRWQKHLSQWPIAYLKGDEELGSQSENPKLIAWLEKQLEQLCAMNFGKKQIQQRIVDHDEYPRLNSELQLVWPCYQAWQQMLKDNNQIDFHTMITKATKYVASGKYRPQWRYVMVDEYQDISPARLELLEAICHQPKTKEQASLYAVGDDWQAIYRFAGADVSLTTDFDKRFPGASIHYLDTTYRFNNMIGEVSSKFVQQNPDQIQKTVTSHKTIKQKSVVLLHMSILEKSLLELDQKQTSKKEVLLLGRNHYHCPEQLKDWQKSCSNLDIRFMTCHASKGQEADFVFILSVDEGQFPATERQHHLDSVLIQTQDTYAHAEERRLFYVALTRAKSKAWVMYGAHPSTFVEELREGGYPVVKK